jgi:hypothetical protein
MKVKVALAPGAVWPIGQQAAAVKKTARTSKNVRLGEAGTEHYCSRCKDWWPADLEFFYPSSSGRNGLNDWCKACYREWRATTTGKARIRNSTVVVASPSPPPALAGVAWLGTSLKA